MAGAARECSICGEGPKIGFSVFTEAQPSRADYRLNGWLFRPIVAPTGPLVAVVEQCPHIALVEWLGQLLGKVGSDMLKDQPSPYHHERCRQDWSEHRVRHVRGDVTAEDYARH